MTTTFTNANKLITLQKGVLRAITMYLFFNFIPTAVLKFTCHENNSLFYAYCLPESHTSDIELLSFYSKLPTRRVIQSTTQHGTMNSGMSHGRALIMGCKN